MSSQNNSGADITVIVDLIDKTRGKIEKRLNKIKTQSYITANGINSLSKEFAFLDKTQNVLDRAMGKTQHKFAGWAMSIMFFGMALKRTFDTIWTSSSKTFNDVMHSVDGTVTGFDMLQGSLSYLGYVVGAALEPIALWLIPWIDKISDLITEHEDLFRIIIIALGVGGTVLTALGAGKLAWNGIADAIALAKADATSFIKATQGVIGVSMVIYGLTEAMAGEAFKGAADALIGAGFLALAGGKGIGKAMVGIGIAMTFVDLLLDNGAKITRENLANWMIQYGALAAFVSPGVGAALLTVGVALKFIPGTFIDELVNAMGIAFGVIATAVTAIFESILYPIRSIINGLIDIYNFITGENAPSLEQYKYTKASMDRTQELWNQQIELASPQAGTVINNNYIQLPDGSIMPISAGTTIEDMFAVTYAAANSVR